MASHLDYEAIRNVIAAYCIALDKKHFAALNDVFTADLKADYPIGSLHYSGVDALVAAIKARLEHVTSQHAITTQQILIDEDGKSATAISYFTGVHFGTGKWDGKKVTAWGIYTDRLVNSAALWKINHRSVEFIKRLGEESVLEG